MRITPYIEIGEDELEERFVQASGPGGQNVNKVATAVQLRFDAANSRALTGDVLARLVRLAGSRMTKDGVLVLIAQRFRTQERNRADARERLAALIAQAAIAPRPRVATRPTRASKRRRLEAKTIRGVVKEGRKRPVED
jgi:ribosome-associated protein